MYAGDDAVRFAEIFLATQFSGEARHVRRLGQLERYERTGELPPASSGR
jgi:ribose 5-phosphate isomerase B